MSCYSVKHALKNGGMAAWKATLLAQLLQLALQQGDMLLFLRRQFAAEILLQPGWQFVRQLLEMVARALLHLESGLIEARHAVRLAHLDAAKEPVGEQLVLVPGKLYHFAIQVRVVFFFQLVKL